jgi:hypothetical protein
MTLTNQIAHMKKLRKFNSGNACPHSDQKLHLVCYLKTERMKYKSSNSDCSFYGFETWFLTVKQGNRLKVFENNVLKIIFGPKEMLNTGG